MASFRKRGKTWQYRIKHNGEEISKGGFRTKGEAQSAATTIEYELGIGIDVNKADQLFIDYYKQWIKTYKIGVYSEETDCFYLNAVKLIEEYFPTRKLKEITRDDYQLFLDDYQLFLNDYAENNGNQRSKETVRKTHTKLAHHLERPLLMDIFYMIQRIK